MRAAHGASTETDLSGLPPRLRARLEHELSLEESGASPLRNWLIAVSVLATLMILLLLMQRFGAIDVPFLRGAAGRHATLRPASGASGEELMPAPTTTIAAPTEVPTVALIDSLRREIESAQSGPTLQTASTPAGVAQPAKLAPPVAEAAPAGETRVPPVIPARDSAAAGAAADTGEHYGVSVAAFLDVDRARGERLRLSRETTLPGLVVPFRDAGTTMYRVVLGRWSTSADAETAANALMERGLINEARVVQIPRR